MNLYAMVTRRDVLASLSVVTFSAGCSSQNGEAPSPNDSNPLSYIAAVKSQATDTQPLTVEIGVQNETAQEVRIATSGRGNPFEELDAFSDSNHRLVAVPVDSNNVYATNLASSPVNSCWRFAGSNGDSATFAAVSTAFEVSVPANGQYSVRHHIYDGNTDGPCFPSGEYTSHIDVSTGGQDGDTAAELSYTLSIGEGKQAAMTVNADRPS